MDVENEKIDSWLTDENARLKDEDKRRREESGMSDLLKLEKGDNPVVVNMAVLPKDVDTKYGKRKVLTLVEPVDKALMCTPFVYSLIVGYLAENDSNGRVTIIKTGEGKDTRYEMKANLKKDVPHIGLE